MVFVVLEVAIAELLQHKLVDIDADAHGDHLVEDAIRVADHRRTRLRITSVHVTVRDRDEDLVSARPERPRRIGNHKLESAPRVRDAAGLRHLLDGGAHVRPRPAGGAAPGGADELAELLMWLPAKLDDVEEQRLVTAAWYQRFDEVHDRVGDESEIAFDAVAAVQQDRQVDGLGAEVNWLLIFLLICLEVTDNEESI